MQELVSEVLHVRSCALRADQRNKILEAKGKIYEAKYLGSVKVRDVFEALIKRSGRIEARDRLYCRAR